MEKRLKDIHGYDVIREANLALAATDFDGRIPENATFSHGSGNLFKFGKVKNQYYSRCTIAILTIKRGKYGDLTYHVLVWTQRGGGTTLAIVSSYDLLEKDSFIPLSEPTYIPKEDASLTPEQEAELDEYERQKAIKTCDKAEIATDTLYLTRKHLTLRDVKFHWQLKQDSQGLIMPLMKFKEGELLFAGYQRILNKSKNDKNKFFNKRCQTKAAFFPVGNFENPDIIYFCEGLGDALTIDMAAKGQNALIVVTLNAGNIKPVVGEFVKRFPGSNQKFVICADNDNSPNEQGKIFYAGFVTTTKTLSEHSTCLVTFHPSHKDFNDLYVDNVDALSKSNIENPQEIALKIVSDHLAEALTKDEFERIFRIEGNGTFFCASTEEQYDLFSEIEEQIETNQRQKIVEEIQKRYVWQKSIKEQEEKRRQLWLDMLSAYVPSKKALIDRAVKPTPETGYSFMHTYNRNRYIDHPEKNRDKAIADIKKSLRKHDYAPITFDELDFTFEDKPQSLSLYIKFDREKKNPVNQLKTTVEFSENRTLKRYVFSFSKQITSSIHTTPWLPAQSFINEFRQSGLTFKELEDFSITYLQHNYLKGKFELDKNKYLSDQVGIPEKGTNTAYSTHTGSGKSKHLKKIVDSSRNEPRATVIVVPDTALAKASASEDNFDVGHYQTMPENGGITQENVKASGNAIVITMHSFHKLQHLDIGTIIFDEANKIRKTIPSSPFLKNYPEKSLAVLSQKLKEADRMVMADAYSEQDDFEFYAKLRGCDVEDIMVYSSVGGKENTTMYFYDKHDQLQAKLQSEVQQKKCTYTACSSKKFSHYLSDMTVEWGTPEEKNLLSTEETKRPKSEDDLANPVMDFMGNPNKFVDKYLNIITSPIINGGLSIDDFPGRQPRTIFAFVKNTVSTARDVNQMISRYRNATSYHVHLECTKITDFHRRNALKEIEDAIKKRPNIGNPFNSAREQYEMLNDFGFDIAEKTLNEQNRIKDDLIEFAMLQGMKLAKPTENFDASSIKSDLKAAMESVKRKRYSKRIHAKKITDARYEMLKNQKEHTQEQIVEMEKHEIRKSFSVEELTEDILELDNEGKTRYALSNRTALLVQGESRELQLKASLKLQRELNETTSLLQERHNPLLFADVGHELADHIKEITGLSITRKDGQCTIKNIDKPSLFFSRNQCVNSAYKKFVNRIKSNQQFKNGIEAISGLKIPDNINRNMRWFSMLLAKFEISFIWVPQAKMHTMFNMHGSLHGDKYYYVEPLFKTAGNSSNPKESQQLLLTALNNAIKDAEERHSEYLKE